MKNKLLLLAIVGALLMMSLLTGMSYAIWTVSGTHVVENMSSVGCLDVAVRESKDKAINLKNTYPITDDQGKELVPFEIVIQNTCSMTANYQLNLEQLYTTDPIDASYIKIQKNNNTPVLLGSFFTTETLEDSSVESRVIDTGSLIKGDSKTYSIRLWVDENATNSNVGSKNYKGQFNVVSTATTSSFGVTFNPNGGVFDDGTTDSKTLQKEINKLYGVLPNVSLDGKTFAGWYTDLNNGTLVTSDTKFTTANNITLYARWND